MQKCCVIFCAFLLLGCSGTNQQKLPPSPDTELLIPVSDHIFDYLKNNQTPLVNILANLRFYLKDDIILKDNNHKKDGWASEKKELVLKREHQNRNVTIKMRAEGALDHIVPGSGDAPKTIAVVFEGHLLQFEQDFISGNYVLQQQGNFFTGKYLNVRGTNWNCIYGCNNNYLLVPVKMIELYK